MNHNKFISFVESAGVELLDSTNEWEVVRFRTENGVSVVYKNKKGGLTFSGQDGLQAFDAFEKGYDWVPKKVNRSPNKTNKDKLLARDGNTCFYCACEFNETSPMTLEHLVSISHGGSNNINNLALACEPCNREVGNMPLIEKIKIREQKRK